MNRPVGIFSRPKPTAKCPMRLPSLCSRLTFYHSERKRKVIGGVFFCRRERAGVKSFRVVHNLRHYFVGAGVAKL